MLMIAAPPNPCRTRAATRVSRLDGEGAGERAEGEDDDADLVDPAVADALAERRQRQQHARR